MESTLAILITTSLVSVGLVAVWAATSPWHWFMRIASYVAFLSLLLLIPTFEPFVAFIIQGTVIALGLRVIRRERLNQSISSILLSRPSYSLLTLMLVTVLVAIVAAVVSRLPALNYLAWQSVVLIGLSGGLATLIGLWIIYGKQLQWPARLGIGCLISTGISLPLVQFDRFIVSAIRYPVWPPIETSALTKTGAYSGHQGITWVPIMLASVLFTSGMLLLFRTMQTVPTHAAAPITDWDTRYKQQLTKFAFYASLLLLVAMPASMFSQLMTPLPIPIAQTPKANGFDDILAASEMVSRDSLNNELIDSQGNPTKELSIAVQECKPAYDRLSLGLAKDIFSPVDFTPVAPITSQSIRAIRTMTRAIHARSLLAYCDGSFADATESYSEAIHLGCKARRGGLSIDALVCIACTRVGLHGIINLRDEISLQNCVKIATMLATLDSQLEPEQDVIYRDQVLLQNANGWHGHFVQILNSDGSLNTNQNEYLIASKRERAAMRLLQVDLALRAWNLIHKNLPQSLDELIPEFLSEIPIDPYDPTNGLLKYRLLDGDYLLYSVGQNGIDEQGARPVENDFFEADLLLDDLYSNMIQLKRIIKSAAKEE